jgi:hypothetical protein
MGRSVSNILETTVFVNGLAQFPDDNYPHISMILN